jgi:phosphate starvation-inducible PhoH-like protein
MSKRSKRAKLANEKAITATPNPTSTETKDTSPYVFQRNKINYDLTIRDLPWSDKQKEIINLFLDKKTKMLILKGPAGSSKTILAMYCGLHLLQQHRASDIVLMRSAVESADNKLGFLPGSLEDKYNVYITPFNDKLEELLPQPQIDKLHKDNRLTLCPVNFARGLHLAAKFICCDEVQNFSLKEIYTIVTRIGEFSKVFMCGDPEQSDLPMNKSGFNKFYKMFDTKESRDAGIYCMELTEDDIKRSVFCKYVIKTFREFKE